jgi:hypothetical protein
VAAIGYSILLISADGGETWNTGGALPSFGCNQITADPFGSGALAIGCQNGVYLSQDWGATLNFIGPPAPGGGGKIAAFDPWHKGWIYAAAASGTQGSFYLSMDFGRTWASKPSPPFGFSAIQQLAPDPDQTNVWYAETIGGELFQTTDGAATWTLLKGGIGAIASNTRVATLSRACPNGGGLFAAGQGLPPGGAILSDPGFGPTWTSSALEVADLATGPGCNLYAARAIASDAFLAKLTPDGTRVLWATYLGGLELDAPKTLTMDPGGAIWVTGNTRSTDFPATEPLIGILGDSNAFVARFDSSGALLSSVILGSASVAGLAVDASGNAYLAGSTASPQFPVTVGVFQTQFDGNVEGFVAKLGSDFHLAYSSFLGGALYQEALPTAVAVDSAGQAIIGGINAVQGQPALAQYHNGFLVRLDPSGSRLTYATQMETPAALALDAAGDLFLSGTTADPNFPITPGAYVSPLRSQDCTVRLTPNPAADLFVMKLRASFQPVYTALLGSQCASTPGALQVDSAGVATFSLSTGLGYPQVNPHPSPSPSTTSCLAPVPRLGAVSQLSPDGSTLLFSTYVSACGALPIATPSQAVVFAGENLPPHAEVEALDTAPRQPPRPPVRH